MILIGFSCPHCGAKVLDSRTDCHHCHTPYTGTLADVARAHHAAKLQMVERDKANHRPIDASIQDATIRLGAVSQSLALQQSAGIPVDPNVIPELFVAIKNE